jgi:hypothetical protein
MSKAEDAVSGLAIGIARGMVEMVADESLPAVPILAGAITVGISIGLSTAIDDIVAARALMRAIETEIEHDIEVARRDREQASAMLRAAAAP